MEFLKKHYEKLVLCLVLIGLAAAVFWIKSEQDKVKALVSVPPPQPPAKAPPLEQINIKDLQQALAQITNPPALILSGEHNTFDPVTWKRNTNNMLVKITKSGPDALRVTSITPLYTVINLLNVDDGPVYVLQYQKDVDLNQANAKPPKTAYMRKDEKSAKYPFVVLGTRGADTDPEINLQMTDTGDTNVWVSKAAPYKREDSCIADLKYDPDSLTLNKKQVNYEFKMDQEPYKIVAITNDAVSVQAERTTKVTEIKLSK